MRERLSGTCAGMQRNVLLMDAVSVHPGAHLSKQLAEKHAQELNFVAQREIAHAGRKVRKGHLYAAK